MAEQPPRLDLIGPAELTWLVGYYGALALSLAVFRPFLPAEFRPGHA